MRQNFISRCSVTQRVNFVVVFVLLVALVVSLVLLNRFVDDQMRSTYMDSVITLFNSFEDGVKGSLERGQMKNFERLLSAQNSIKGVMEADLYDRSGKINLSSNGSKNGDFMPEALFSQINATKKMIISPHKSTITIYGPQLVIPDCIRCHPGWKKGEIGGVLGLTCSLESLNTTIRKLKIITSMGALILLSIVSLIILLVMRQLVSKPVNHIIENLSKRAKNVETAALLSAESSQSLSDNVAFQSKSLKQTQDFLKKIQGMIDENVKHAGTADTIMAETNQVMTASNGTMAELNTAIENIETTNKETASTLKLIDDVAFQTNLLALNAAVEAARAGEAGVGFAVVADEVRNLALRVSTAAGSINTMLEASNAKISRGVQFTQKARASFSFSTQKADEAVSLINQISVASKDQSRHIEKLAAAIFKLGQVTKENLEDAQKASRVSNQMQRQFENLNGDIERLKKLMEGE